MKNDIGKDVYGWAKFYSSLGLHIIPMRPKEKRPLTPWSKYLKRSPTATKLERWFKGKIPEKTGIAVICGINNLIVLDIEDIDYFDHFFRQSLEEIAKETWVCKTGKGYHIYFRYKGEKKNLSAPKIAEVKANKCLCTLPPSIHPNGRSYEWISNIESTKIKILSSKEYKEIVRKVKREIRGNGNENIIEKCIKYLSKAELKNVKKKNEFKTGSIYLPEKIYDHWNSLSEEDQFYVISRVNEVRKDALIDPKQIFLDMKEVKKKVQKDDKIQICSLIEKDRIIEEIYIPESKKASFIVYDPDGIRSETEIGPYIPKEDDILRKNTIILPEGVMDYGTAEELKDEIKSYIHEYVDIPSEFEELSTYYILLTWVYDKLETIPYLRPIGDTSTGKSRFLKVVGGLCYHRTSISGAVTPAPIYRMIEQWKPTLIIDEGDVRSSNEKNEFITILNCGFEKNNPVVRCNKDDPDKLESHEVFCPKLIATRYRFEDSALESRCITIEMRPTGREDIPILLPKKFYEKRKELQKKLLKFRLDTYFLIDSDVSERLQKELHRDIDKRLLQATGPLLCLTNVPGLDRVYKDFIETYNVKLIEERGDSTTGIIVNALFDLIKTEIENKDLQDLKITPGDVSTYITEKLKEDISNAKVGRELKAVGIESKREWDKGDKKTKRILTLKPELLREIQLKYRLSEDRINIITDSTDRTVSTDRGVMGIPEFLKIDKHELKHESSLRSTNSTDRTDRTVSKKSQREKLQDLQKLIYDLSNDGGVAELNDIIKEAKTLGMNKKFVLSGIDDLLKTGEIWNVGNNRFRALKEDHIKEESIVEGSL